LRATPCDLTLNLMRYLKGVFPAVASGASVRLGLPPSKTRDGVRWFNTHHLPERPWCHTQDLFLGFRTPLGLPGDAPVEWGIAFSVEERAEQAAFFGRLAERGRPVAGLVLATANRAKDWRADRHRSSSLVWSGSSASPCSSSAGHPTPSAARRGGFWPGPEATPSTAWAIP
jgi:ADP-heptose:LPS heptosyltransferase